MNNDVSLGEVSNTEEFSSLSSSILQSMICSKIIYFE
jgi:hypothetical protein